MDEGPPRGGGDTRGHHPLQVPPSRGPEAQAKHACLPGTSIATAVTMGGDWNRTARVRWLHLLETLARRAGPRGMAAGTELCRIQFLVLLSPVRPQFPLREMGMGTAPTS